LVDIGIEDQLYKDLEGGSDGAFAKHFSELKWEERAAYAKDLKARLDNNHANHPELPELKLSIQPYRANMSGTTGEYVEKIEVDEERSALNPKRWFGSNRTGFYELYSPTIRERLDHGVARWLQIESKTKQ
jgi:hypothetical protein